MHLFRAQTYAGSLYSSIFCRGYRQRRTSSNFPHLQTYTLPPLLVGATSPSSSQTMPLSTYIDRTKLSEVRLEESQTCESATRVQSEMTFPPPKTTLYVSEVTHIHLPLSWFMATYGNDTTTGTGLIGYRPIHFKKISRGSEKGSSL